MHGVIIVTSIVVVHLQVIEKLEERQKKRKKKWRKPNEEFYFPRRTRFQHADRVAKKKKAIHNYTR